jgi:hypothetical protein
MVSTKIVGDDQAFVTASGQRLYSIKQLVSYMKRVDGQEYSHHANSQRNDFANWVSDVFKEKSLAKKLSPSQADSINVLTAAVAPQKKKTASKKSVKKVASKKTVAKKPVVKIVKTKKAEKKVIRKPAIKVKKPGMFEKNPHVKTEEEEIEEKRLNIHEQIEHLENQTKHLTRYHKNTNRAPLSDKDVDIKEHLVDFTLGLIIGIVLGFVLAKSLGLFA